MGKYMRKAKITGEVAVMEVASSQSSFGVRTRAKTLALQRLQKSSASAIDSGTSYLQLRSRRLEKKPPSLLGNDSKKNQQTPKLLCGEGKQNQNPSSNSKTNSRLNSSSIRSVSLSYSINEDENNDKEVILGKDESLPENFFDVGIEASFGENCLEFEERGRSTRETTPCSLIRGSDTIGTPGSTTRPTNSSATNRRRQSSIRRNIPTANEMDEFFSVAEQQQQRVFTEKYNFDPVSESPLPGRYEWERIDP
ncbi:hypothetical protein ACHQM5_027871 [Ranunculus cassubicifolius]